MSTTPAIGAQRPYSTNEIPESPVATDVAVSAARPQQPVSTPPSSPRGDDVQLDPEKPAAVKSVPSFSSWDEPNNRGIDGRDRNRTHPDRNATKSSPSPRSSAQQRLESQTRSQGQGGDPMQPPTTAAAQTAGRPDQESSPLVEQANRTLNRAQNQAGQARSQRDTGQQTSNRSQPNNRRQVPVLLGNRGKRGNSNSAGGTSPLLSSKNRGNSTQHSPGPVAASNANGASSALPENDGTELNVQRNDAGRQRLRESDRSQRRAQEQSHQQAQADREQGRLMGEQADKHGQAQQGFNDSAAQNLADGKQNLQLAAQNTQQGQKTNQQGLVQQLLAQAQKKVQQMEKAKEQQGKVVEKAGQTTERNGRTIETTGKTVETTGHSTEATGHTTEATGVGMQATGQGLLATGAALAAGVFTAPAGAALLAQGALMTAGGLGLQATGKGLQATGKGLQVQGQGLQGVGKQTQAAGKQTQTAGKQQQAKAKEGQQKAKQKEARHTELFKKLVEEAKKLFQKADQNKQDAGKNFENSDKDKKKGQDEGKNKDQAVDRANDSNKSSRNNQKNADKAKDNQRAIDEALKKAFGPRQEQSQREQNRNQEENPQSSGQTSPELAPAAQAQPGNSSRRSEVDEENNRRHNPQAHSLKNRRRHVYRPGHSGEKADGRREAEERLNPLSAMQGEGRGQERDQPSGDQRSTASQQSDTQAATRVSSHQPAQAQQQDAAPAEQLPSAIVGRQNQSLPPAFAPFQNGRAGGQTAPGRRSAQSRVGSRPPADQSIGSGNTMSTSRSGSFGQLGSDGKRAIQPTARPESQKGKATFEVGDKNVTVKLNELDSGQNSSEKQTEGAR